MLTARSTARWTASVTAGSVIAARTRAASSTWRRASVIAARPRPKPFLVERERCWPSAHRSERFGNSLLFPKVAVEQHEAATAGTGDLAPDRAQTECLCVRLLDEGRCDSGRHLLL